MSANPREVAGAKRETEAQAGGKATLAAGQDNERAVSVPAWALAELVAQAITLRAQGEYVQDAIRLSRRALRATREPGSVQRYNAARTIADELHRDNQVAPECAECRETGPPHDSTEPGPCRYLDGASRRERAQMDMESPPVGDQDGA